jgi:hypothetical protein
MKKLRTQNKVEMMTIDGKVNTNLTSVVTRATIRGKGPERRLQIGGQIDYTRTAGNDNLSFNDTIKRSNLTREQKVAYDAFEDLVDSIHAKRVTSVDYDLKPIN